MLEYLINRDRRHATMIDRTITQHAWRAVRRMSQDLCCRRKRTSSKRISWSKNNYGRRSKCGADVRRPGVVGNYKIHRRKHCCNLIQTRLARHHNRSMAHPAHHLIRNIHLVRRTNQHNSSARIDESISQCGVSLSRPTLRTAVYLTRTERHGGLFFTNAMSAKQFNCFRPTLL